MFLLGLILFIISCFLLKIIYDKNNNINTINKEVEKENEILLNKNREIKEENKVLLNEKESNINEIIIYKDTLDTLKKEINASNSFVQQTEENMERSLSQYEKILENNYHLEESSYDSLIKNLQINYEKTQQEIIESIEKEKTELDKIRSTRIAAIEAQLKEKEIKNNKSFYCIQLTDNEKDDIRVLERVKPNLHQPRILCMLIWSTYYQKLMTTLCNNVLGTNIVSGIYKITNQETNECYIGQAVDVAKRWKDHAKCGLGIDTPANNQLYQAMKEYGLHSFSFELLESCSKEDLNEKEQKYIDIYQSYDYGYNQNKGIKKS